MPRLTRQAFLLCMGVIWVNAIAWYLCSTRSTSDLPIKHSGPVEPAKQQTFSSPLFRQNQPSKSEPIVFSLVMMGRGAATEGANMIKSALIHASRPIDFHIICSEDAVDYLDYRFSLFDRPYHSVRVYYYPIDESLSRDRSRRADIGSGQWAQLTKVFMHEIVPVDRAIFVDTDMLFFTDPAILWDEFRIFNSSTLIAMPIEESQGHAGQICSCVMLMDFKRMRNPEQPFMPSSLLPETQKLAVSLEPFEKGKSTGIFVPGDTTGTKEPFRPELPYFADQGIFHIVNMHRQDLFKRLKQDWDVTQCQYFAGLELGGWGEGNEMRDVEIIEESNYEGRQKEDRPLSPGILHFNCQDNGPHGDSVFENEEHMMKNDWGPYVLTVIRYKWTWFNRGDGSGTVTREKIENVMYLDQRLANERG